MQVEPDGISPEAFLSQLEFIGADMDQTRALPDATVGYDVLSDALIWSDEYPASMPHRMADFQCVRLLLRYRTTLLLNRPDETLKPYWNKGRTQFPNWAGFHPDRLMPTDELRKFFDHQRERQMRLLRRLNRLLNSLPEPRQGSA